MFPVRINICHTGRICTLPFLHHYGKLAGLSISFPFFFSTRSRYHFPESRTVLPPLLRSKKIKINTPANLHDGLPGRSHFSDFLPLKAVIGEYEPRMGKNLDTLPAIKIFSGCRRMVFLHNTPKYLYYPILRPSIPENRPMNQSMSLVTFYLARTNEIISNERKNKMKSSKMYSY